MNKYLIKSAGLLLALLIASCSLWEYDDKSDPVGNQPPETYLAFSAHDTIYHVIDELTAVVDTVSGETTYDTSWTYLIIAEITASYDSTTGITTYDTVWTDLKGAAQVDTIYVCDTLQNAFTTISTSQQTMYWWGEDRDGDIVAYEVRWNSDPGWTRTTNEDSLFSVPIRTALDVFQFYVRAIDDSGAIDPTPAMLTFPIRNSAPEIEFRYGSNPTAADHGKTAYTFGTRTFVWDVFDLDGTETITNIFYALDDTCDTCWNSLDAQLYSGWTLRDLEPGEHAFFLKARDIAGAESPIIQFPDSNVTEECQIWVVKPAVGDVLLVNDYPYNESKLAQKWYEGKLHEIIPDSNFSIWEIGSSLPYSTIDINATLGYFKDVIWFSAYLKEESYSNASASIQSFIENGGDIFLNVTEIKDTSFVFFPLKSQKVINPSGRFFPNRRIVSQVTGLPDLVTSYTIGVRVKSFVPDSSQFATVTDLYHLAEPITGDEWTGTPNVCSMGQFQASMNDLSGKIVFMSIPLHNGSTALLEGETSSGEFLRYLLTQEFAE